MLKHRVWLLATVGLVRLETLAVLENYARQEGVK